MELPHQASKSEVKKRYIDLTKIYHPDIWKHQNAHPVYQMILEAYGVLENAKARERYDQILKNRESASTSQNDNTKAYRDFEQRGGPK